MMGGNGHPVPLDMLLWEEHNMNYVITKLKIYNLKSSHEETVEEPKLKCTE